MTPIYHITHVENISSILEEGGLWSDSARIQKDLHPVGIAHEELKQRRLRWRISAEPGGCLGDYVPFYFANRSPMLYSIHTGYVEQYKGGQSSVVYLVSSLEQVASLTDHWLFSDGHGVEEFTSFYDSVDDLNSIDWKVIEDWSWHNRDDDLDRKRRKQAEFLIHHYFPWIWIKKIGVLNPQMVNRVSELIKHEDYKPAISIESKWYYD